MKRFLRLLPFLIILAATSYGAYRLGLYVGQFSSLLQPAADQPTLVEEIVPGSTPLTPAERIYGLALVWDNAKDNFPFFKKSTQVNWNQAFLDAIPAALSAKDDLAYYRILQHYAASLNDGHSKVRLPDSLKGSVDVPAIQAVPLKQQFYLTGLDAGTLDNPQLQGAQLIAVDGQPVESLATGIQPYLSVSTTQDLWAATAALLLEGPSGSQAVLTVQSADGQQRDISLPRNFRHTPWDPAKYPLETRDLGNGIRYVAIRSFSDKSIVQKFNQAFPNFDGVSGLILDVRDNGGGNSSFGNAIFQRLIGWPAFDVQWQTRERLAYLDAAGQGEVWLKVPGKLMPPASFSGQYRGPIVVLTNASTYSAAENFTALFQINRRATLIGQKTGGSTGQPINFKLPGGGSGAIVTKWDRYPDGKEFVGVGIVPDIEMEPTPADLAARRDPVLEKAIQVLTEE